MKAWRKHLDCEDPHIESRDDEANKHRYFGDNDIDGMFNTLEPLHDMVDKVLLSPDV